MRYSHLKVKCKKKRKSSGKKCGYKQLVTERSFFRYSSTNTHGATYSILHIALELDTCGGAVHGHHSTDAPHDNKISPCIPHSRSLRPLQPCIADRAYAPLTPSHVSTLTPCRTLTLNRRSHLLSSPLAGRPALHLLAATTTTTTGSFVSRARAQSRTMARTQCQPGRLPSIRSVREGGAVGLQQTTGTVCLPGARTCKSYSVRPSVPSPPATNEHETCTART